MYGQYRRRIEGMKSRAVEAIRSRMQRNRNASNFPRFFSSNLIETSCSRGEITSTSTWFNDFGAPNHLQANSPNQKPLQDRKISQEISEMLAKYNMSEQLYTKFRDHRNVEETQTSMTPPLDHPYNLHNENEERVFIIDVCSILKDPVELGKVGTKMAALEELADRTRTGSLRLWDEFFDELAEVLLEVLQRTLYEDIRQKAMRTIAKICQSQPNRFSPIADIVFTSILKMCDDFDLLVRKTAAECGCILAVHMETNIVFSLLLPIINSSSTLQIPKIPESRIVNVALKMVQKLIGNQNKHALIEILPRVAPVIVEAYNNDETLIRNAAVLVLVAIYEIVGDELRIYMRHLHFSRIHIFEAYVKEVREGNVSIEIDIL
ncbi:hypothetical protein L596_021161 [Steinernema carpocapsae]|uniref:TOG domain-containing protein n=1 Tax=Steinernema carpocapsae TaxID=34508 RepID=A0A4U5MVP1_STECR|nr:hypothetical protein L596_021161 [Steinernema carpocapsae]